MLVSDSQSWHKLPERCKASFSWEGYSLFVPYRCFIPVEQNFFAKQVYDIYYFWYVKFVSFWNFSAF